MEPEFKITYYRIRPFVNEDDIAARVIHVPTGTEARSALDVPSRHVNRRIAMKMVEAFMGVLDRAGGIGKVDRGMIPEGATSVTATGTVMGWSLYFETPYGKVEVKVGDMERAIKLAVRLTRIIKEKDHG